MNDADFKRYLFDLHDARQNGRSPDAVRQPRAVGEGDARGKTSTSDSDPVASAATKPLSKPEMHRVPAGDERVPSAGEKDAGKSATARELGPKSQEARRPNADPVKTTESAAVSPSSSTEKTYIFAPSTGKNSSDQQATQKSGLGRLWTLIKWIVLAGVILVAAFIALGFYLEHGDVGGRDGANSSPGTRDSSADTINGPTGTADSSTPGTGSVTPSVQTLVQSTEADASAPSEDQSSNPIASPTQRPAAQAPVLSTASSPSPNQAESPATIFIRDRLVQPQTSYGCGDLAAVYCEATLARQATHLAYEDSVKCDQSPSGSAACPADGDIFIARRVKELEVRALTAKKASLERYLMNPEKENFNTDGNTRLLAEPCKQQAVRNGLRGQDYTLYVNETCLPQARDAFLKPQRDLLAQVTARLAALASDTQSTVQTLPTSPSALNAGATAELGAVGSPELRCGWIENNLPSSLTLRDRTGTWSIVNSNASAAPDGFDRMPPTSSGSSCGCLTVQTNSQTMQVSRIFNGKLKPLSACMQDKSLRQG
jgi:hypothetical protein